MYKRKLFSASLKRINVVFKYVEKFSYSELLIYSNQRKLGVFCFVWQKILATNSTYNVN